MKTYFYVDDNDIIFSFRADRKIIRHHVFTRANGMKKYTVVVNYCSAIKEYHVFAKLNDGVRLRTLWSWNVPYVCNGQRYEFYYDLKKGIQPILGIYDYDIAVETRKRNTTEISVADDHLRVMIQMSPKNAKYVYTDIKKHHYVSPMYWDSWIGWYDCKCKACEGKEHQSWLSNPDIGYVRNPKTGNINFRTFVYRSSFYTPIEDKEYETLVFYNRDEYQRDVLDYYYPELEYCKWYSRKELTVKIKNNPKWADMCVGTDTFDSLWNAQKMYRFVNGDNLHGKVYKEGEISEEDKKLMTESTMSEKVVTLAYKQFEKTYMPFDELWKSPISQEEIDENANAYGGAWRHKSNKKTVWQKDDAIQFDENDFEKVVTLGYHKTQVDDAIECPVCRDLYDIMRSGYEMVPWYKRLITPYQRWKYRNK